MEYKPYVAPDDPLNQMSPQKVSVILGISYHADVRSSVWCY